MPAHYSDCRYAICGDQVPVAGTQYTKYFSITTTSVSWEYAPLTFSFQCMMPRQQILATMVRAPDCSARGTRNEPVLQTIPVFSQKNHCDLGVGCTLTALSRWTQPSTLSCWIMHSNGRMFGLKQPTGRLKRSSLLLGLRVGGHFPLTILHSKDPSELLVMALHRI